MKRTNYTDSAIASLCLCLFANMFITHPAMAGTTFLDDFEGSFDGAWEVVIGDGTIEIVDGQLLVDAPTNRPYTAIRPLDRNGDPILFQDVSIQTRMNLTELYQVGFYSRADYNVTGSFAFGVASGYGAIVDNENLAAMFVQEGSEAFRWLPGEIPTGLSHEGAMDLRFDNVGSELTMMASVVSDPSEVYLASYNDAFHDSGEVGLLVWGDVAFDYVSVTTVPEPPATSMSSAFAAIAVLRLGRRWAIVKPDHPA